MEHVIHEIPPLFSPSSSILILGSFPSVKSRECGFFYGHPQNRFWKVLSGLFREDLPVSIPEKQQFLLRHHIAVWDVIASCEIHGSSDSSIKNALPNDLSVILSHACIRQIFCNGTTSWKLYQKYMKPQYAVDAVKLPSTSPANAAFSLERLTKEWSVILPYLKNPS